MPNEKKPIDWNTIRAEYIGGGISQRKLAQKYGISERTLLNRANKEKWSDKRKSASNKSVTKAEQKVANVTSDNAVIAQRIKQKLLMRLEHEIDNLPQMVGTELFSENVIKGKNGERKVKGIKYKLNDLTQSYKNLVGDMPEISVFDEVEDDPLTKSLKEFAEGLESGEDNAD
ncbi:MAG: hypothetical protein IJ740_08565 [Ruminococcus sp.]|nr:hypothetical protein [Ruminococcus sp.]